MLTKDGANITFRYAYGEKKAELVYPAGTRLEKKAHSSSNGTVLPDLQEAMGAILPRISTALLRYPDSEENGDETYREVYRNFSPDCSPPKASTAKAFTQ